MNCYQVIEERKQFSDEEKEQFLSLLTKVYTKSKQIRKQGK